MTKFLLAFGAFTLATPVWATQAQDLSDALRMSEVIAIMQEEGLAYGNVLATEMLPSGPNDAWAKTVEQIYDADTMLTSVNAAFEAALEGEDLGPLLEFYATDTGTQIIDLELEARAAMVDEDVEESAREVYRGLDGTDDVRLAQISEFIAANDLIESNIAGGLNATLQFYVGLNDGGAFQMTESEILSDVWAQEPDVRLDTREWVYAYLLLAYGPLDDNQLDGYIEMSRSPAGQAMNQALFKAFNGMYDTLSYAMGRAIADHLMAMDL